MRKLSKRPDDFGAELRRRLEENKRLYRGGTPFVIFDSPFGRFVASYLGVNPWKVLIPVSFVTVLLIRAVVGMRFPEFVLRILGGR